MHNFGVSVEISEQNSSAIYTYTNNLKTENKVKFIILSIKY